MKSGFVNIFGKPNAGKSTLLNALMGEKLAIVSHKVQTTRHRIKGILSGDGYQVIFSDTPGIIEPRYRLHEKMMETVRLSVVDADLALLLMDGLDDPGENDRMFNSLNLKVPALVLINKSDRIPAEKIQRAMAFFQDKKYCSEVMGISALKQLKTDELLKRIIHWLPEGEPFFDGEEMTDRPVKFFASELIREKIFSLYEDEIPYHS